MAETEFQYDEMEIHPTQPIDYSVWKDLYRFVTPYKREIAWMVAAATLTGVLEPFYALITKWLLDDVSANGADAAIWFWGLVYLAMSSLLALGVAGFIFWTNKIRVNASFDLRHAAFKSLQKQSFAYFDRRPVGWLVARLTSDCERLTNILAWALLDLFWSLTMMVVIVFALVWLNWKLTLIMVLIMPLIVWISAKFQRTILSSARKVRAVNSRITGTYNESIMGVETSKTFVLEQKNAEQFTSQTGEMRQASVRNLTLAAIYVPIIVSASSLSYGLTLAYGGSELLAGAMAVTSLITFMMLVTHFFEPFEVIGMWFAEIQMAQASAERLLGVIKADPDITDSDAVQNAIAFHQDKESSPNTAFDGGAADIEEIRLENVSFEYKAGKKVLTNIDLSVRRGETIAFVGPTGGGKTTLVNVICRFYEPTSGTILIDGVDYRNRSQYWLQSNLGMVLQQAHIFSGTIRDNIRYGRLDATNKEVEEAAQAVEAHDFIVEFENGYETEVGEGGSRLSSGQKQLISFARAILADPQVLVLDEATSSVDTETERKIQRGIERLLAGRISFIIAHRLTTIKEATRIVFIDDGSIAESGTHRELLEKDARYADLYKQQSLDQSMRAAWHHETLEAAT